MTEYKNPGWQGGAFTDALPFPLAKKVFFGWTPQGYGWFVAFW